MTANQRTKHATNPTNTKEYILECPQVSLYTGKGVLYDSYGPTVSIVVCTLKPRHSTFSSMREPAYCATTWWT